MSGYPVLISIPADSYAAAAGALPAMSGADRSVLSDILSGAFLARDGLGDLIRDRVFLHADAAGRAVLMRASGSGRHDTGSLARLEAASRMRYRMADGIFKGDM